MQPLMLDMIHIRSGRNGDGYSVISARQERHHELESTERAPTPGAERGESTDDRWLLSPNTFCPKRLRTKNPTIGDSSDSTISTLISRTTRSPGYRSVATRRGPAVEHPDHGLAVAETTRVRFEPRDMLAVLQSTLGEQKAIRKSSCGSATSPPATSSVAARSKRSGKSTA